MASKTDWLDAGLEILAAEGAPALTIERLTGRLGLSKGSFYHHFGGMGGFRTALLRHFEDKGTTRFIEEAERDPAAPPLVRLRRLLDLVVGDETGPELEIAVRAWALQDPEVRRVQERIDATRMAYLRSLWRQYGGDAREADRIARLLYLITIGAEQIVPTLAPAELREVYELTIRLATRRGEDDADHA
ncbi:TetR/AcrR family transcriptional regulator [Thermomonospora cellulosilytica]|uniref:AcrR family transcriptional regulator n=1 Tax=Thermomonospora cellulosilytica TaxID=1411118 RepID=A0A7W3RB36_9ACTN|nr:TetR/AcrR family transcriptional regulator [Thermomonospora cellulosilytica]MBA9007078.1 AcrR family transcriptional regulator [Thermomonospora cellulosilytica]